MEKSKRKEREFILRRTEILEESVKIFSSKGFHNTTVAEIAQASGFAVGTLYQFFDSKESLYAAMVTEKLDMLFEELKVAVENAEGLFAKVSAVVKSQFRFVENNVEFCSLFIRGESTALSEANAHLRDKLIKNYLNYLAFVEDIIREGIEEGLLKSLDPKTIAIALIGIIRSFIFFWLLSVDRTSLCDGSGQVVEIFLKGVKTDES
jgi:AcrR family transcriptional regulator